MGENSNLQTLNIECRNMDWMALEVQVKGPDVPPLTYVKALSLFPTLNI